MQIAGKGGVIVAGTAHDNAEFKRVGQNETAMAKFSVYLGKGEDGKGQYANCVAWRDLAEYASGVCKDDPVIVAGKLESREYEGKTYTTLNVQWMSYGVPRHEEHMPMVADPGATFTETADDDLPF